MNQVTLWALMGSIFFVLSFSLITTTKKHISDANNASYLQAQLHELSDSINDSAATPIIIHVTDTVYVEKQTAPVKIYIYDTLKIQDTIYFP